MLIRMHSGQKIRHMLIVVTAAVSQCKDAVGADFASHSFIVIVLNQSGGLFRAPLIPTAHSDNLMTSQCIKCIVENYMVFLVSLIKDSGLFLQKNKIIIIIHSHAPAHSFHVFVPEKPTGTLLGKKGAFIVAHIFSNGKFCTLFTPKRCLQC